jgi:hypothetical protein
MSTNPFAEPLPNFLPPYVHQIVDRWHILHNIGEALEKALVRHHADLKRVFAPKEV